MPILLLLVKATVVLLMALAATLALRHASAGARHLVWLVTFIALLSLPLLAGWSPLPLRVLPAAGVNVAGWSAQQLLVADRSAPTGTAAATPPAGRPSTAQLPGIRHATRRPFATPWRGVTLLVLAWALVALLLLAWLTRGALMVRRIVGRAIPLDDRSWQSPLYQIADRLGLDHAPRLLRSADVRMPFACGLRRATVVLPADSDHWTADRRDAVLIHELAHIRRRDLAGHTLSRVACALYWFHPLVWTAAKRLRSESERACDDLALTLGERPSDYAEHLLDIVTCVRNHATPAIALAMAHRKEFEGRMLAILDPELSRSTPGRRQALAIIAPLGALALLVSAAAPLPRQPSTDVLPPAVPLTGPSTPPIRHDTARSPRTDARINLALGAHAQVTPLVMQTTRHDTIVLGADSLSRGMALVNVLRTDSSADVRRIAAWSLRNYSGMAAARTALIAAAQGDADADVRTMSVWALADIDGASVTAALMTVADHDADADVREMAVWAIGDRAAPAGLDGVTHALASDRSAEVRATAAWALGQLDLKHAPASLIAALKDSSADVRNKAAWAVSEIGDSTALPALRDALRRETSVDAQRMLLRALITSGEDPERMVEWLRSPDPELREMAARALAGADAVSPWPWPWPRPIPIP